MKYDWVDGLAEGWDGLLGLLGGLSHIGCEPCCSRGPSRALVAAIFQWEATRTGMIGGPVWTGFVLHTLHARTMRTALGYSEGYSSDGHGGPHVPWEALTCGVADSVRSSFWWVFS